MFTCILCAICGICAFMFDVWRNTLILILQLYFTGSWQCNSLEKKDAFSPNMATEVHRNSDSNLVRQDVHGSPLMTRKRKVVMATMVGIAYVLWGCNISIQPPIYPREAERKGATPSQVGI